MMKQWIVIGIGIALIVDVALFFGLGIGLTSASVATPSGSSQYAATSANVGSDYPVLTFTTPFPNVAAGAQLLTSILPSGQSTPLQFGTTVVYDLNGCDNWPAWDNGETLGHISQYYTIQFSTSNVNFLLNGVAYTTSTGSYTYNTMFGVNYGGNNPYLSYCIGAGGGSAWHTPGPNPIDSNTLILQGIYAGPVTVVIQFNTIGAFCNGNQPSSPGPGPCGATAGAGVAGVGSSNGGWAIQTSTTATYQSGYATAVVINPGNQAQNGGQIQIAVTTGYGGFQVCLLIPQPRPNGGQCDPQFPTQTVPNGVSGKLVTWSVPNSAAQNSTVTGWNVWELQLTNEYFNLGYTPVDIVVSFAYAPGLPAITFSNSGSYFYPQVGNTVQLTIYANASKSNVAVTGVSIEVYYLPTNQPPTQAPSCGQWVTSNCPYSTAITGPSLSIIGNNAVATFSFVVSPPSGATENRSVGRGIHRSTAGVANRRIDHPNHAGKLYARGSELYHQVGHFAMADHRTDSFVGRICPSGLSSSS